VLLWWSLRIAKASVGVAKASFSRSQWDEAGEDEWKVDEMGDDPGMEGWRGMGRGGSKLGTFRVRL
jgi:hypothetical protein